MSVFLLRVLPALLYLLFCSVLFFLPGDTFPQEKGLHLLFVDKWIHFGLFATLAFLWCRALLPYEKRRRAALLLALIMYGVLVEWIQANWAINRSGDVADAATDAFGALAGIGIWQLVTKINPGRNRGRNQN